MIIAMLGNNPSFTLPFSYYFTNILNKPIEWIWYAMIISGLTATMISVVWLRVAFRKLLPAIAK